MIDSRGDRKRPGRPAAPFAVVGLGSSAGGLEALERFLRELSPETNAAFVIVQHLSPDHKSLLVELLSKQTPMPVREATDGMVLEPSTVAIVPAKSNLELEGVVLRLRERKTEPGPNLPINLFFASLAVQIGHRAVAIVLSGTGSDGSLGIVDVKRAGGLVLAQEPSSSRFDGMPLAAIATGIVDAVLTPEGLAEEVQRHLVGDGATHELIADGSTDEALAAMHRLLLRHTGVDFAHYKPATVLRRVVRRLAHFNLDTLAAYVDKLHADKGEIDVLYRELLINVTEFFRDPGVFDVLMAKHLAPLVTRAGRESLRIWVPGCSTGQEAYSIAMLLSELDPIGGFKIFATDIALDALEVAGHGQYDESLLTSISPARLKRHFRKVGTRWEIDRDLRRRIVFARHDVTRDPPFTRLDFISCRNLLIYLSPALQKSVLTSFAFALKPDGLLLLGTSETLGDLADRFRPLDQSHKIFQRREGAPVPHIELASVLAPPRLAAPAHVDHQHAVDAAFQVLIDKVAPAAVLVDERFELVRIFGNADRLLSIPPGPATLNLMSMLPPELQTITSMAAHRALSTGAESLLAVHGFEGRDVAAIRAVPIAVDRAGHRNIIISFERDHNRREVVERTSLTEEAERQVLELQRELTFVRESLQATIEELETTNEELQVTNEELLATNEELQSTNEDLQSMNEELNTVNAEHQSKIGELMQNHADLDNLFKASAVGPLFLDAELNIRRFTPAMTEQFSLLERDIGRPVEHITHQFRGLDLTEVLRKVQHTAQIEERELVSAGGQRYLMRVAPYLTIARQISGVVATFVDVTQLRFEQEVRERLQQVIDSLAEAVAVLSPDGTVIHTNLAWTAAVPCSDGRGARCGVGANYLEACRQNPAELATLMAVMSGEKESELLDYRCDSPTGERWYVMRVGHMAGGQGLIVSHLDVTRHRSNPEVGS